MTPERNLYLLWIILIGMQRASSVACTIQMSVNMCALELCKANMFLWQILCGCSQEPYSQHIDPPQNKAANQWPAGWIAFKLGLI